MSACAGPRSYVVSPASQAPGLSAGRTTHTSLRRLPRTQRGAAESHVRCCHDQGARSGSRPSSPPRMRVSRQSCQCCQFAQINPGPTCLLATHRHKSLSSVAGLEQGCMCAVGHALPRSRSSPRCPICCMMQCVERYVRPGHILTLKNCADFSVARELREPRRAALNPACKPAGTACR